MEEAEAAGAAGAEATAAEQEAAAAEVEAMLEQTELIGDGLSGDGGAAGANDCPAPPSGGLFRGSSERMMSARGRVANGASPQTPPTPMMRARVVSCGSDHPRRPSCASATPAPPARFDSSAPRRRRRGAAFCVRRGPRGGRPHRSVRCAAMLAPSSRPLARAHRPPSTHPSRCPSPPPAPRTPHPAPLDNIRPSGCVGVRGAGWGTRTTRCRASGSGP